MSSPQQPPVSGAEIIEVALPLRRPYRSGTTSIEERALLLVRMRSDGLEGWGECGPIPGYTPETLDDCRGWLTTCLAEMIEGRSPAPGAGPASARFAVEAALADLTAQHSGIPLWQSLGATGDPIPVGAVIGLAATLEELPRLAEGLAAEGYRRIKLKIDADRGPERVAAVRAALPHHDLAVDANGTLDPSEPSSASRFEGFDLSFIEQPFPADALAAHARFTARGSIPVCLDESITGIDAAAQVIEAEAATVINVKPARVGGLADAVAIHDLAVAAGLGAWCGGMLESGIGKAAALAVAGLPGMTLPADLPPSSRHFRLDISEPSWEMEAGAISLPDRPGAGAVPDPDAIALLTRAVTGFGDALGWRP